MAADVLVVEPDYFAAFAISVLIFGVLFLMTE